MENNRMQTKRQNIRTIIAATKIFQILNVKCKMFIVTADNISITPILPFIEHTHTNNRKLKMKRIFVKFPLEEFRLYSMRGVRLTFWFEPKRKNAVFLAAARSFFVYIVDMPRRSAEQKAYEIYL